MVTDFLCDDDSMFLQYFGRFFDCSAFGRFRTVCAVCVSKMEYIAAPLSLSAAGSGVYRTVFTLVMRKKDDREVELGSVNI